MRGAFVLVFLTLLFVTVGEHGALSETEGTITDRVHIEARLNEPFTVKCFAFDQSGQNFLKNYGSWIMQQNGLRTLELLPVDLSAQIVCQFVWRRATDTLYEYFAVYLADGMPFYCGETCHWTVDSDAIYLFNPATSLDTRQYEWIVGDPHTSVQSDVPSIDSAVTSLHG